jgi:hypothetical protein
MMRKLFLTCILFAVFLSYLGAQDMNSFKRNLEISNADYGTRYTIGEYQLCPEKKLILERRMFGTATIDAAGFFPDESLKYDEETMVIFAGYAFFDKSGMNIDWRTVELLSYSPHYTEFTDGKTLYYFKYGGAYTNGEKYDKNTYKPKLAEKPAKRNSDGVTELTEDFCVKGNKFYFGKY